MLGVDNLNDAYDVRMKSWRLNKLQKEERFKFKKLDISDKAGLEELVSVEAGPACNWVKLATMGSSTWPPEPAYANPSKIPGFMSTPI